MCSISKILGNWGSRKCVEALKIALLKSYQRRDNYQVRGVIVKSLSKCVNLEDCEWLLDHYFNITGVLNKHMSF